MKNYDVIIVGGGHAGTEAALAAARRGCATLLVTQSIEGLGQLSCNPAIGGIGKGHLVKEIDAMGGMMALAADRCGIQFRVLNRRKGPAVRATRTQIDRSLYRVVARELLEAEPNLAILQQSVEDLVIESGTCVGVRTQLGMEFRARAIVLTVGTFLGGVIHVGQQRRQGGRAGDAPANRLAEALRDVAPGVGRLKTGTPPRIDARSIDFTRLEAQPGDTPTPVFSFLGDITHHPEQVPCHITHTNADSHAIINAALHLSPMYSGQIESVGPRYCPSIEDKVVRFADKASHQIFLEPEGLRCREVYPNGISTSLPVEVQVALVNSIAGMERARITRPGYAIEYDYFDPRGLKPTLETKAIPGLFYAGQINGTTGYEEAGAQGLLAGINAAARANDLESWWPGRDQAYLGVMVDDLITRGTIEPYRMFTSRAEYRLRLREDNADARLTPVARRLGLVDDTRWQAFERKQEAVDREGQRLAATWLAPHQVADVDAERVLGKPLRKEQRLVDLLKRPEVDYAALVSLPGAGPGVSDPVVAEQVEIQAYYAGYIERQEAEISRLKRMDGQAIPENFDYASVRGLAAEAMAKLEQARPATLGHAARIDGMTPAAVSLLAVHLKRGGHSADAPQRGLTDHEPGRQRA